MERFGFERRFLRIVMQPLCHGGPRARGEGGEFPSWSLIVETVSGSMPGFAAEYPGGVSGWQNLGKEHLSQERKMAMAEVAIGTDNEHHAVLSRGKLCFRAVTRLAVPRLSICL